jgi:hypothetical protein
MLDSINRFRLKNGVRSVEFTNREVDHYCKMHCLEMSRRQCLFHAPDYYLEGWSEAIAMMQYCEDWKDKMIFDILGSSDQGHRDILLNSDMISYADYVYDWVIYVTIRGKKN